MNANLGWMFYVDYFAELNYEDTTYNGDYIDAKVDAIVRQPVDIEMFAPLGNKFFYGTTTYPGLLVGTGYPHEIDDLKNQAILGLYFDYTTGLPVVPGSSIKGKLRSVFSHTQYISELLQEIGADSTIDIAKLEQEIFGQKNGSDSTAKGKDIFFDAVITELEDDRLLADDYLAVHGDNPLKEPNVLRFIKIAPRVTFRFDFELHEGKCISANQKALLFAQILGDMGIGAKTNTGYGYLDMDTSSIPQASLFDKLLGNIKDQELGNIHELLKKYRANENFSEEEKELLFRTINPNIQLDDGWYGESVGAWLRDANMSNGERRRKLGYEYYNILRTIFLD